MSKTYEPVTLKPEMVEYIRKQMENMDDLDECGSKTSDGSKTWLSDPTKPGSQVTTTDIAVPPVGSVTIVHNGSTSSSTPQQENMQDDKVPLPGIVRMFKQVHTMLKENQKTLSEIQEHLRHKDRYLAVTLEEIKQQLDVEEEDPEQTKREAIRREQWSIENQEYLKQGVNLERQTCIENNATIQGVDYSQKGFPGPGPSTSLDDSSDSYDSSEEEGSSEGEAKPAVTAPPPPTPAPVVPSTPTRERRTRKKRVHFEQPVVHQQPQPTVVVAPPAAPVVEQPTPTSQQPVQWSSKKRKSRKNYDRAAAASGYRPLEGSTSTNGSTPISTADTVVVAKNASTAQSDERQAKKMRKLEKIYKEKQLQQQQMQRQGGGRGGYSQGYPSGGYGNGYSQGRGGGGGGYRRYNDD
jgi:hypothetical protein